MSKRGVVKTDLIAVLLLLIAGAFQIATVQRLESFGSDSSVYIGLASNILETGRYEFNYRPHTVYPPGFPFLLAGISFVTGQTDYDIFILFMPALSTLALIVWYFVLRQVEGRLAAAIICLLVATSAPLFQLVTQSVLSDGAFFLMSGLPILCLLGLQKEGLSRQARLALLLCLCLSTAAALLIRSAGIAISAALIGWASTAMLRGKAGRTLPSRPAMAAALTGLLALAGWTAWTKHVKGPEYEVQHVESYASQFTAKDPHRPELGTASVSELFVRAIDNVPLQASHIAALLTRAVYILPAWYYAPVVLTLLMLCLGLFAYASTANRLLLSWYFVAYFAVYLLWPFDEGPRYMLPVAPLAFALIWRGVATAGRLLRRSTVPALTAIAVLGLVFAVVAFTANRPSGLQARISLVFWPLLSIVSVLTIFVVKGKQVRITVPRWLVLGAAALAIVVGGFQQAAIARANLHPDAKLFRHYSSADCSAWLKAAGEGVVMAHQAAIVHRLTGRKVVNFPISGDAQIILRSIRKEKVRYVVVNDEVPYEYYFPTEVERWRQVERAYPLLFQLAHRGPGYRVFESF